MFSMMRPRLTNQDETRGLKDPLVVPVGMLLLHDITDTVVLTKPNASIHHQTWNQTEGLMAHSESLFFWDMRRIVHVHLDILHQRRIHLTIHNLRVKYIFHLLAFHIKTTSNTCVRFKIIVHPKPKMFECPLLCFAKE